MEKEPVSEMLWFYRNWDRRSLKDSLNEHYAYVLQHPCPGDVPDPFSVIVVKVLVVKC
jgi:hypothetical protein